MIYRISILTIFIVAPVSFRSSGYLPIGSANAQQITKTAKSSSENTPEKKPEGMSDAEWEKAKAKRPLPFDNGPSSIDISGYPSDLQNIYNDIFTKRCSRCHTIARAINAPYSLPAEWNKYIKKMMKKPGSGINPEAGRQIYRFLVYDSEVRKKDDIERKLKQEAETGGTK